MIDDNFSTERNSGRKKNPEFRLLVAITLHYVPARLPLLLDVARSFLRFPVDALDLVIVTNTSDADEIRRINTMLEPLIAPLPGCARSTTSMRVESHPHLVDPWHLPWCHKHLIKDQFLADPGYTHFVYAEDDILMSHANFLHFIQFREVLEEYGLIPGFQRIEYNNVDGNLYLLDQIAQEDWLPLRKIEVGAHCFITSRFPHCASFILDRSLAETYCASLSFDRETSLQMARHWGLPERASMGLCHEDIPPGFNSRYALPVDKKKLSTLPACWIFHISNTYTTQTESPFGKIRPDQMFASGQKTPTLVLNQPPPPQLSWGGYVDHVHVGSQTLIHGWGLLQTELGERSVTLDTNLPIEHAAITMLPRSDVVAALGDKRLASAGFQIRLSLDKNIAWPLQVRMDIWTEDAVYGRHRVRIQHLPPVLVTAPTQIQSK